MFDGTRKNVTGKLLEQCLLYIDMACISIQVRRIDEILYYSYIEYFLSHCKVIQF